MSTVSRRICELEDELGLALFESGRACVGLTAGGAAVVLHDRRTIAEIDAIRCAGSRNKSGGAGEVRLGVWMPPIGEPLRGLLTEWQEVHPDVVRTIFEMNERDIATALEESHLNVALMTKHILWPRAVTAPIYREPSSRCRQSTAYLARRTRSCAPDFRHSG